MNKKVVVVGAGLSGLATGCFLQKQGWEVTILEKNAGLGGRARQWKEGGYTFDLGPSWYLFPEIFEVFFSHFGFQSSDFYQLKALKNQMKVFTPQNAPLTVTTSYEKTRLLFESLETGSAKQLDRYMKTAKDKYRTLVHDFLRPDKHSLSQVFQPSTWSNFFTLGYHRSLRRDHQKYFSDRRIGQVMELASFFLGCDPQDQPAASAFFNHALWGTEGSFPLGGFFSLVQALESLFIRLGGTLLLDHEVKELAIGNRSIHHVETPQRTFPCDLVVNSADYAWAELELVPDEYRSYPASWWHKKTMTPSMFIAMVGVKKKMNTLEHHNFFITDQRDRYFHHMLRRAAWPTAPNFYLRVPSQTDPSLAPEGCESLFLQVPVPPALADEQTRRQEYLERILLQVESLGQAHFQNQIEVCRTFGPSDFKKDFHSFKGTAFGLAPTRFQAGHNRPSHKSRKLHNLFHTGQYTTPGAGLPMSLIAAENCVRRIKGCFGAPGEP